MSSRIQSKQTQATLSRIAYQYSDDEVFNVGPREARCSPLNTMGSFR